MSTEHERVAGWQNELLPQVVDRLGLERPDAVYGEWVYGSSVVAITYAQVANIVNGLAKWLVKELGPGQTGAEREVLTYVGPNDVRYSALVLAAIKAGHVLFVTSPRNSPAAHRALFDHLKCRTFITTYPVPPAARAVLDAVQPPVQLSVPSVAELLSPTSPSYVMSSTFQETRNHPFVIMHTSGTTGIPKPIVWTHETCNQVLNAKSSKAPSDTCSVEGYLVNGKRIVVTLPPFHGALLAQLVVGAIPFGNIVIAPVVSAFPTAQSVVDALKQSLADVAILIPSVVAELAQNPELLDFCAAHLDAILYIGGDLPQDIGDRVAAKVYLRCLWGATETGIVPQLLPPEIHPSQPSSRSLWRYVRFHPCVGAVFDEVTDGVYELVIRREQALLGMQPCFTVPGIEKLDEYRTKDLFEPHPSIPDLWCWRARSDDIIVFLNGEKTNPISMEQHIMASNREVSGALVIGAQRFQAALLVEPASETPLTTAEKAAFIERIWPSIEVANRSAPAHARVEKAFVLVVPSDRRFIRAGKGTFMRDPSISQYETEIAKLYADADTIDEEDDGGAVLHDMGHDVITRVIRDKVSAVTKWSDFGDSDSFFDSGMDSLQGLQLVRALKRSLHRPELALSTIYRNPTVSQLADDICKRYNDGQDEDKVMQNFLTTYKGLLQGMKLSNTPYSGQSAMSGPANVLLTGSTGTVGRYLLRALLDRVDIGHIFCLNRGEDGGKSTQHKSFTGTGLDDRVTFIKADLQKPLLGLEESIYESLRTQVSIVIHTAWPVNFNLSLYSFRPQLAGLVNLLSLTASTTASGARFVFISSVSAIQGFKNGPAPEAVLDPLTTPASIGYSRSKFLGELLVDFAAKQFQRSMSTVIIRVGQVAGPVQDPGLWNPHEWFPSLILSSLHLGMVPDSLGLYFDKVDFVPVDLLAPILVDLATSKSVEEAASGTTVFNLRNPELTPWTALLPVIAEAVEVVAPETWLASLRRSNDARPAHDAINNPAIKLIDFFTSLWAPDGADAVIEPMMHQGEPGSADSGTGKAGVAAQMDRGVGCCADYLMNLVAFIRRAKRYIDHNNEAVTDQRLLAVKGARLTWT